MEVRKNQYVTVFYNDSEREKAEKYKKYLLRLGYSLEHEDADSVYDNADQYYLPMRYLNQQ